MASSLPNARKPRKGQIWLGILSCESRRGVRASMALSKSLDNGSDRVHCSAWNRRRNGGSAAGSTSSSKMGKMGRRCVSSWGDRWRINAICTSAPTQRCIPSCPINTINAAQLSSAFSKRSTQLSPLRIPSSSWKTLKPAFSNSTRSAMHASRSLRL